LNLERGEKLAMLMNPKELAQRYMNYHATHSKIYHNHTKIYQNDVPICDSLESALTYVFDISPETYEKIQEYICKAKYVALDRGSEMAWDEIKEYCPDSCREYVEIIRSYLFDVFSP